jgi:threonine aldolase
MSADIPSMGKRGFASDNYAGIHPKVLEAIADANGAHEVAYGDDTVTLRLSQLIKQQFGQHSEVFPVFNGTGANVVALQAATERWGAVICPENAHIHNDEGGAPEKMAGLKLWTVPTQTGKLTPEMVESQIFDVGFVHRAQPGVVSISNTTEFGTVYSPDEVRALAEVAHKHGLYLHMDGARLANAAAALNLPYRSFTTDVGVDLVSFGGTKIGALAAEAVLVLNTDLPRNAKLVSALPFLRKTSMQLASKMRFTSAQLIALLTDDLAIENARHANAMAAKLDAGVRAKGLTVPNVTQANAVFPILTAEQTKRLQQQYRFYVWNQETGQVRWMCSWDTTIDDVEGLLNAI